MSIMWTRAPIPAAIFAALVPTTPAPRKHTRDTPEEDAEPALGSLEVLRAFLDRHAARDLTHGGEQGQLSRWQLDRLIGDRYGSGVDARLRQPIVGGEVEVGEEDLAAAHAGPLDLDGLLDLHDHLGASPDFLSAVYESRTGVRVEVIGESAAQPSTLFDHELMPGLCEHLCTCRRQRHTILVTLDLLRNTDQHLLLTPLLL
jgi:hypothetical protein